MNKLFAISVIIFGIACSGARKINTLETKIFDKEGHRGCRGLLPENTIPAMLKAVDLGVNTLETDAIITKDKKIILSHEPFFNHEIATKPDGSPVKESEEKSLNIYQMDYAQVEKFDVGMRAHPRFDQQQKLPVHKPLLSDMIDAVELYSAAHHKPAMHYNIETKSKPETDNIYHPEPAEFVELLVAVILGKKVVDRVTIQSFDIRTLQYLHTHYPAFKTSLLIEDFDKKPFALQLKDLGFIPTTYSPEQSLVTPLLVKQCHDAGILLLPWTVNKIDRMKELQSMGVDGVISDYPDLFSQL